MYIIFFFYRESWATEVKRKECDIPFHYVADLNMLAAMCAISNRLDLSFMLKKGGEVLFLMCIMCFKVYIINKDTTV